MYQSNEERNFISVCSSARPVDNICCLLSIHVLLMQSGNALTKLVNYILRFVGSETYLLRKVNLLYTGILFHCYMLDESICHFRDVESIFFCFYSIFDGISY